MASGLGFRRLGSGRPQVDPEDLTAHWRESPEIPKHLR